MGDPLGVPPGFDELPVEEQSDYVQSLWRRIAKRPGDVPSPAWHIEVLERRRNALEADGDRGPRWAP